MTAVAGRALLAPSLGAAVQQLSSDIVSAHVQVERKRHIGNDIVTIVFQEGEEPSPAFKPSMIRSHFTRILGPREPAGLRRPPPRHGGVHGTRVLHGYTQTAAWGPPPLCPVPVRRGNGWIHSQTVLDFPHLFLLLGQLCDAGDFLRSTDKKGIRGITVTPLRNSLWA